MARGRSRSPRGTRRRDSPDPDERRRQEETSGSGEHRHPRESPVKSKLKQNYGLTGALARDAALRVTGDVERYGTTSSKRDDDKAKANKKEQVKYFEPSDARMPVTFWRLYIYPSGADQPSEELHLHRKSFYVLGGDDAKVDIRVDGLDGEHAVLQFRRVDDGKVLPFLIDLESTSGTMLNGEQIATSKYVELRDDDVVSFGAVGTECVLKRASS